MKTKLRKALIACSMIVPMIFATGCKNSDSSSNNADDSSIKEMVKYSVTFPSNQIGYVCVGPNTVIENTDYTFLVNVQEGYDASQMTVKVNGEIVNPDEDDQYIVRRVNSNLTITVDGVAQKNSISIPKNSFAFNIAKITQENKTKAFYLQGVTGIYMGNEGDVDVDLSGVNFEQEGEYTIVYYLVNDSKTSKCALVCIYGDKTAENVSIDLSNYSSSVVDAELFGIVNNDFTLIGPDGEILTADQVRYDTNRKCNYLTADYIKTLTLNTALSFKLHYYEEYLEFTVTITDNQDPLVVFSKEAGEYGFKYGDEVALPIASIKNTSIQNVTFKYYLNDEEIDPTATSISNIGSYAYRIEVYHKGEKINELTKEYKYIILEDYNINEGTDLNGSFLFYNSEVFAKYFAKTTVRSTDPVTKTAVCTSDKFTISHDLFAAAKLKGYNYMSLRIEAQAVDGDDITSIPFVSKLDRAEDEEKDFWKSYWQQNNYNGPTDVLIDLTKIDLDLLPTWNLQFSFRTAASGGADIQASFVISHVQFSENEIVPEKEIGWVCTDKTATLNASSSGEGKYTVNVSGIGYNWKHLVLEAVTGLYNKNYKSVNLTLSGNKHVMFAYANNDVAITNYTNAFPVGGGTISLDLTSTDDYVGIMTSRSLKGTDDADKDGVYGTTENITLTLEFIKEEPCEEYDTFDKWSVGKTGKFTNIVSNPDEGKFAFNVKKMTTKWDNVIYSGMNDMYSKGYRFVKVKITGNNHTFCIYRNTEAKIGTSSEKYSKQISAGGGSVILAVDAENPLLGIFSTTSTVAVNNDDEDGHIKGLVENISVEVTFATENNFSTLEESFLEGEAWSNVNGGKIEYNSVNQTQTVTSTWQMDLSSTFVQKAISKGYKTVEFDVLVGHSLGGSCNYLQLGFGDYKHIDLDSDGNGHILIVLSNASGWRMRGKTAYGSSYGTDIASMNIRISNVHFSDELPSEYEEQAKAQARTDLENMLTTESNSWAYIHHNGFGTNNWGPTNKTLNLSDNDTFNLTTALFKKMKDAGYTKISFNVSATKAEGKNDIYAIHAYSYNASSTNICTDTKLGSSVTMTLDATALIAELGDTTIVIVKCVDTSSNTVRASFTISNITFAE